MPLIDHTLAWVRGEALEMSLLTLAGFIVLALAGVFWRFSTTPVGQALTLPLTVVAVIFMVAGISGQLSNPGKIREYRAAYESDPVAFVHSEKARVERFESIYKYTVIGAAAAFAMALIIFVLSEHAMLRAIAVSLVFLGFSGLVIDMFSKERATTYALAIKSEIESQE